MKSFYPKYFNVCAAILLVLLLVTDSISVMSLEVQDITFTGQASGGELLLCNTLNRNCRFVSITTTPGETAESVAKRLSEKINTTNPFLWVGAKPGSEVVSSSGGTLKGIIGTRPGYILAGTETGLGIPRSPTSLSCSYLKDTGELKLQWINPPGGYDVIWIVLNWKAYSYIDEIGIAGELTSYVLDAHQRIPQIDVNDLDIWLIGFKNDVPSNAAAVHVNSNAQEELFGIPFTNGVAPNWLMWSYGAGPIKEHVTTYIDEKLTVAKDRRYNAIKTTDAKPFKQILRTPAEGGTVGIWRKFLGLTPGHTYRISARLSTLQTDPNEPGWSFSLNAVPDSPGIEKLTERQMAGITALPDGKSGPAAGRIANFGPGVTTKGQYEMRSADVQLPQDSNSITVWLRLSGKGTSGVGFDWIKLEDLSAK